MILLILKNKNKRYGLERETLRVDENERLSQTRHPFKEKNLTRDFCENQLEIVTDVFSTIDEAAASLKQLSDKAAHTLQKSGEHLWLYSNPPFIEGEEEIPIAKFKGEEISKQNYRCYLADKYGKKIMLYSGIHFNLSFEVPEKNKNDFYMQLLKKATKYSYVLVLLTAASPVYDKSFETNGESGITFSGKASMRNSNMGYWNNFTPILDYSCLETYCESIKTYIKNGSLISAAELYVPVRIKPKGENDIDTLINNGADHIELRMFDINPLFPVGICKNDLEFAGIFLEYLSSLPDFNFTPEEQIKAFERHKKAAEFNPGNLIFEVKKILFDMKEYFVNDIKAQQTIQYQIDKISGKRYAQIIMENITQQIGNSSVQGGYNYV